MLRRHDSIRWHCHTVLKKYHENRLEDITKPYEVKEIEGNALVSAGITAMWDLIVGGGSADAFNHANSTLEVYTGAAYEAGTLDGSSPETITGGKKWKASWAGSDGDGVWSKWKVTNGTVDMNEKTEGLGTKSGGTWTLECSITLE